MLALIATLSVRRSQYWIPEHEPLFPQRWTREAFAHCPKLKSAYVSQSGCGRGAVKATDHSTELGKPKSILNAMAGVCGLCCTAATVTELAMAATVIFKTQCYQPGE